MFPSAPGLQRQLVVADALSGPILLVAVCCDSQFLCLLHLMPVRQACSAEDAFFGERRSLDLAYELLALSTRSSDCRSCPPSFGHKVCEFIQGSLVVHRCLCVHLRRASLVPLVSACHGRVSLKASCALLAHLCLCVHFRTVNLVPLVSACHGRVSPKTHPCPTYQLSA